MDAMLEQILMEIHNWFRVRDSVGGVHPGVYAVEDGRLALPFLRDGQYFRVMGSLFNDGLHQYGDEADRLTDETFEGTIWALAVPKAVVELAGEIAAWQKQYGAAAASPYQSESFGGYSYTMAGGASQVGAANRGWQRAFRSRLNQWRKLRES